MHFQRIISSLSSYLFYFFFFLSHLSLWRRCEKDTKILVIFPVNTFIDSTHSIPIDETCSLIVQCKFVSSCTLAVLYNWIGNVFGDLCFVVVSLTIYIGNKVNFFFFFNWNENSFLITNFHKQIREDLNRNSSYSSNITNTTSCILLYVYFYTFKFSIPAIYSQVKH